MTGGAYVGSISAVRDFRAALCTFAFEAREAVGSYDLEVRRALEWLLEDRPRYWQQAVRRSEEAVVQAKIELERRRAMRLPGGETPSCMVERKTLERARQRREYAEQKVETVRKWGNVVGREATEYSGRANQLHGHLDADLPQAIAMLDRALAALESYAALKMDRGPSNVNERTQPAVIQPAVIQPAVSDDDPPAAHGTRDANLDSNATPEGDAL